jgi:hypothetical protein
MKIKSFVVILVALAFVFAISCKEKAKEAAPAKAEVKAKAANVEKAEAKETEAKAEKAEKGEEVEKGEKEEKEEKAEAGEKEEAIKGKEAVVDLKILPPAVLAAFKTAYPNAVIKGTSKETEKGVTYYEVESVDGKLNRDLLYTADGKAAEIEEAILPADLPAAVQQTLAKEYPGYKIIKAETLTKGDVKQFELSIQVKEKTMGVTIDPAGKIVEKSGAEGKTEKAAKTEKK